MVRPKRPKVQVQDPEQYIVEAIISRKIDRGVTYYLLKWKDWPSSANTWEPASNLACPDLIDEFERVYKENQLAKAAEITERIRKERAKEQATLAGDSNHNSICIPSNNVAADENPQNTEQIFEEEEQEQEKDGEEHNQNMEDDGGHSPGQGQVEDENETEIEVPQTLPRKTPSSGVTDEKKGFERGLKADRIIGAYERDKKLYLLVLWEGVETEAELVPASICNIECPQLVIAFYEEKSVFTNP